MVERERYRMEAADAAQGLAEAELEAGDPAASIEACEWGLRIDRHRDQLWRLRIESGNRAGDHAGSASAGLAYDAVLAELGLPPANRSGSAALADLVEKECLVEDSVTASHSDPFKRAPIGPVRRSRRDL